MTPIFHASVALALLAGGVVTLLGPFAVGAVVHRRTGARWRLFLLGAATFFVSQCILRLPWQIPLGLWMRGRIAGHAAGLVAWLAASALTAALFEEIGRFVAMRFFCKDERSWRVGLMMGAGHGGIEAILLVALSLLVSGVLYLLWGTGHMPALAHAALSALDAQFAKLTWWDASAATLERVIAVASQMALSVVVAEGFVRGRPRRWLGFAIGGHFLLDFAGVGTAIVLAKKTGSALVGELPLLIALAASAVVIAKLRPRPHEISAGHRWPPSRP